MYTSCDIDKVWEHGETWAVDPELREAFDQLGAGLRGEIRSSAADLRGEMQAFAAGLRGEIRSSAADLRGEIRSSLDERFEAYTASLLHEMRESELRMRRHFDVVTESLRADNRSVAEGTALVSQRADRQNDEQAGRSDRLEGRVLRLEVRVKSLEGNLKPGRPRRRR